MYWLAIFFQNTFHLNSSVYCILTSCTESSKIFIYIYVILFRAHEKRFPPRKMCLVNFNLLLLILSNCAGFLEIIISLVIFLYYSHSSILNGGLKSSRVLFFQNHRITIIVYSPQRQRFRATVALNALCIIVS